MSKNKERIAQGNQQMQFQVSNDLEKGEKGNSSYEYNSYYEESSPPEEIQSNELESANNTNEVSVPDEIEDSQSFEPGMSGRVEQDHSNKRQ